MSEEFTPVGWQYRVRYREHFHLGPPYGDWLDWSPWIEGRGDENTASSEAERRQIFIRVEAA